MIGEGDPSAYQSDRAGAKSPIFDLFACSGSAETPSEKSSLNSNRKSDALSNEPKMNIVRFL